MFKWMNFFKKDKTPTTTPNAITPLTTTNPLSATSPITNITTPLTPTSPITNTTDPLSATTPITNITTPLATAPVTNITTPIPTTPVTNITTPVPTVPVTNIATPLATAIPVTNITNSLPVGNTIPNDVVEPVNPVTISQDVNKIISLGMQIKELSLFTSIGDTILSEISTSGFLSPTSLNYIIESGQKIIGSASSTSSNSTDINKYISAIDEMLKLPPLEQSLDHDNLVDSNINSTVQNIIKYYNVCEKSLTSSSNESLKSEFSSLTPVISGISSDFTNLISLFKNFKSSEHNLRQEIEAYTNAVTQIQSQGVNIDWGGKKEAFEQKGAELTTRRNAYVEEEKQINAQITNLSNTISSLYPNFMTFLNNLKSDLTSNPTAPSSNGYENQITSYLQYSSELKSIVISE